MQSDFFLPRSICHLLYINEDGYWGQNCSKLGWFRTAPYEIAVDFSFELDPRSAYENNGHRLPFGCHAWPGLDTEFWRPHIESFGYRWWDDGSCA